MNEIVFLVEEAAEGGYTARALGESIFTEADSLPQLHDAVSDAVHCHFDDCRRWCIVGKVQSLGHHSITIRRR